MPDPRFQALAAALTAPDVTLRTLNLEHNSVGPVGAGALAKALARSGSTVVQLMLFVR